jgi:hypothetical protein
VCFFHFVCRERKQSEVCVRELAYKRRERDREVGEASTAKAADGRRERDVRRGVVWWVGPRGRAVRGHRLASAEPRRLVSVCGCAQPQPQAAAAHTRFATQCSGRGVSVPRCVRRDEAGAVEHASTESFRSAYV